MQFQDDMNTTIVLYPDFVVYRDNFCTGLQLTFSPEAIKITGSTDFKNQKPFDFQWEIGDVTHIMARCFQAVSHGTNLLLIIANLCLELNIYVYHVDFNRSQQ